MATGPPADGASLVVVKLGGSVLTRKARAESLRPKVLARLAREIARADGVRIVLLHGAGSFGHPGARRFRLASPPEPGARSEHRLRGAAIVSSEVLRLHLAVVRALVAAGANPISMPPHLYATLRDGRLASLDLTALRRTVDAGALPVAFGDVVPDEHWGFGILSADEIAVRLAEEWRPSRVLFVSDVPGVLAPRGAGRPRLIESLSETTDVEPVTQGGRADVTGGIRAKVDAMRRIAHAGVDVGLISGLSDGLLYRALRGETVYGSWWGRHVEGSR